MTFGDRDYYKDWKSGEVIDLIKNLPFVYGSAIKYLLRPGKHEHAEDLEKSLWYVRRIISDEGIPIPVEHDSKKLLDLAFAFADELQEAGYGQECAALVWLAHALFEERAEEKFLLSMKAAESGIKSAIREELSRTKVF